MAFWRKIMTMDGWFGRSIAQEKIISDLQRIENKLDLMNLHRDSLLLPESLTKTITKLDVSNTISEEKTNSKQVNELYSGIISGINKSFDQQFSQFESLLSLYKRLPNLRYLSPTRGWAGSPDFLLKIAEVIMKEKPHFVLEISSGVSTAIVGLSLKLNGFGRVTSLEHDDLYALSTSDLVKANEITSVSEIKHCPLLNHQLSGEIWKWYDIQNINFSDPIDILLIDGPPGSIQPLARYPAIPLLFPYFAKRTLILLDDANREDEKITVDRWIDFLKSHHFLVKVVTFDHFEKGLALLEVIRDK